MAIGGSYSIMVSGAQLTSLASQFSSSASTVRSNTNNMLTIVSSMYSVWKGNAANTYKRKFDSLRDDMERMYKMWTEHCEDLKQIAKNYETAETTNTSTFNGLNDNPVQ